MLIVALPVIDYALAAQQLSRITGEAQGVELRLDYLDVIDIAAIGALRKDCTLPVIFTLRSRAQGGQYPSNETQRLQDILALCQLQPDYFDLEYDVPIAWLQTVTEQYPAITLISSYHNFKETPADLDALFQHLHRPIKLIYKIATHATSVLDALRMMRWVKACHGHFSVIGLCMGEMGLCTRILSPAMGNTMSYAYLDAATAPGQLSLQELLTVYHYSRLNIHTQIYAFLCDPVAGSVGHYVHNQAIDYLQRNAIYVKLQVTPEELATVVALCRELSVAGLSITMPLKEAILPLLDEVAEASQPIQAINSVMCQQRRWVGFNTDGIGAIQALSEHLPIAQQTIVILGAGGAARAIAYEALQQQATVIIVNRTLAKAQLLAEALGATAYALAPLSSLKSLGYTVIINTLPDNVYADPNIIALFDEVLPNTIAMDIVYYPVETSFLRLMRRANCRIIAGFEMYMNQALLQIQTWFEPSSEQLIHIKALMRHFFQQRNT